MANDNENGGGGRPGDAGRPGGGVNDRGSGRRFSRNSGKRRSSRKSFLTRMGESFKRSGGQRGADVETLRGTQGADFEGRAQVVRGEAWGDCPCCMDVDDAEEKLLLIKGTYCFVFYDDGDLAPKYAISLTKLKPMVRDGGTNSDGGRMTVVTLETKKQEVEYEITFDDATAAKQFRDAVAKQAALGKAEFVAKVRLFSYLALLLRWGKCLWFGEICLLLDFPLPSFGDKSFHLFVSNCSLFSS